MNYVMLMLTLSISTSAMAEAKKGWLMYGDEKGVAEDSLFVREGEDQGGVVAGRPASLSPTASAVEQLKVVEKQREWDRSRAVGEKKETNKTMLGLTQERMDAVLREVNRKRAVQ